MLKVEFGGMNEMFYNLYALTGNTDYLELGKRFEHKSFFDPLANHQDKLKGLHVNTQIPKIIGVARAYELTGDKYYRDLAVFFWKQVVNARTYSTGGTSNYEYWRSEPYHLSDQLSAEDHENCCTYNMLKLTGHIFSWEANPILADYYERALFNGIMGTQHPEVGGAFMYYVPMKPGLFRFYCEPDSSYVCCSGTGIESFAKFGDNIYFHNETELYVNQFIASEVDWFDKNVKLIQQTKFPEEEGTTLIIKTSKTVDFALYIRIPYWATKENIVKLNGNTLEYGSNPGSYFIIKRKWNNDDRIEISFPMSLHLNRMPDDPKRVSIMYGPLVLAGALGDIAMNEKLKWGLGPEADRMNHEGAAIEVPKIVVDDENLESWIKPIKEKPLTFLTIGAGKPKDMTLIPFNRIFGQRYSVYWDIISANEWNEREKVKKYPDGVIDIWMVGDKISDDEHNFQAYRSERGDTNGKSWVKSKSWFRFDININPEKPVILCVTYYGDESNNKFDLFIDGIKITTPRIQKHSDEFYQMNYELPLEQTKGKIRMAISYKVPDRRNFVNPGDTSIKKDVLKFETPKFFGCEVKIK
jgi:hypothetical protein